MKPLSVVILAAGSGTRMKSELPKVLHPMCGRPMIAYALDLAAASGIKQPVVILGESAEQIQSHLPKEVKIVIQSKPLGTGNAVLLAKRAVGVSGDVLVLYADTPLLRRTTIQRLIESHHRTNATCTLLTTHLADPTGYGRLLREATGEIVGIAEEAEATAIQRAIREINVGPICVRAQALFDVLARVQPGQAKKEMYLTQAINLLAKEPGTKFQAVRLEMAMEGLGVNSQHEMAKATAIIRQRIIDSHLNNGVTIVDPQMTYIDHGVSIGHDTIIHPGTVIESGVSIGRRCSIGPFARLRRGVALADEVQVGNFVELVRTKVGTRVRMNHMTYLGDTTVEEEVNIGAGTITANYDGTRKSPTVIGKGAFIGCDTVLVAPVTVGSGAVTGAGAVIPKGHDVPARGVVVGIPARPLGKAGGPAHPLEKSEPPIRKQAVKKPVKKKPVKKKPARKPAKRPSRPKRSTRPKRPTRRARPTRPRRKARRVAKRPIRKASKTRRARPTVKRRR
ncbi:MAG: bifunctional N-acetylglucosamine-1-phosphate uridyltransferase/glucosamine-1-phosphate acetyltransferase [Candidatus Omnitrophica bacterium]|nr:bifunctional N-acetylglucosamine-1-phosphate uridyltransferase/glucosamine-1-phosphate acetyltransferase [Candidatus Omnitrophota bacterium]